MYAQYFMLIITAYRNETKASFLGRVFRCQIVDKMQGNKSTIHEIISNLNKASLSTYLTRGRVTFETYSSDSKAARHE